MRIGFMLASIHTGSSINTWPAVARQAALCKDTLFTFPGGRLGRQVDFEYLRNNIYQKARSQMIDGLLIWGSSLSGTVDTDDVRRFCGTYSGIPLVTISCKTGDNPDVSFESYYCLKHLIMHMIRIHDAKKIVFIRGPLNHFSSEARFRAYLDALKEESIPVDQRLITSPMAWNEGEKAISQILDERKLVAGKDFDTVIAASDFMAFAVSRRLEGMRVSIPSDVRLGAFNDSIESRLMSVPLSTVHMPYYQIGYQAYSTLRKKIDGQSPEDCVLDSPIIIRSSCGCNRTETVSRISSMKDVLDRLTNIFVTNGLVVPSIGDFLCGKNIRKIANEMFEELVQANSDLFNLNAIMVYLRTCNFVPESVRAFARDEAPLLLCEIQDRVFASTRYQSSTRAKIMNSLKCDLLGLQDPAGIGEVLQKHLPNLGLNEAYVVLEKSGEDAQLVSHFTSRKTLKINPRFSSSLLLPEEVMITLKYPLYVVEPLFIENQSLGYVVLQTDNCDGSLIEELRSTISSSISSALMFQQLNQAKETSERTQREKDDFFASIAELIEDPLTKVREGLDGDINATTRGELQKHLVDAMYMFNIALSKAGGLKLDYKIINPREMFLQVSGKDEIEYEMPDMLPAIRGDKDKLLESLRIIASFYLNQSQRPIMRVSSRIEGLMVEFSCPDSHLDIRENLNNPKLSYVRSILLLHSAAMDIAPGFCRLNFSYPVVNGRYATPETKGSVVSLSPDSHLTLDNQNIIQIRIEEILEGRKLPEDTLIIMWDAKNAGFEDLYVLKIFREDVRYSNIRFLCYNCPEARNMEDSLRRAVNSENPRPVLLLGPEPEGYGTWVHSGDTIKVRDFEALLSLVPEAKASMIISSVMLDKSQIASIRQSEKDFQSPILLVSDQFDYLLISSIQDVPNLLIASSHITSSEEFSSRIRAVIGSASILPVFTGVIVKRAQVYLLQNMNNQINRAEVASFVNVSDDYLTRIFKKEIGLSPWDYLNRCRIHKAMHLLLSTSLSNSEIAKECGFQDQAYFCRVFKKIIGTPPGKLRSRAPGREE